MTLVSTLHSKPTSHAEDLGFQGCDYSVACLIVCIAKRFGTGINDTKNYLPGCTPNGKLNAEVRDQDHVYYHFLLSFLLSFQVY